jgi:hypothetical protein
VNIYRNAANLGGMYDTAGGGRTDRSSGGTSPHPIPAVDPQELPSDSARLLCWANITLIFQTMRAIHSSPNLRDTVLYD